MEARLEPLPGGARTHWKAPPYHGARPLETLHAPGRASDMQEPRGSWEIPRVYLAIGEDSYPRQTGPLIEVLRPFSCRRARVILPLHGIVAAPPSASLSAA